ncbi:MAG: SDR family NAD(P)-dependent oxidoreductase [Gammaproteobacteria bacterium]|nr:SDR family NAD(P)-dependent oxidoreductase [Gammaproteobacteria bacterium]
MSIKEPIAIVGIGCRFPSNVVDAESFWRLLIENRSGVGEVPKDRWNNDRFYHPDNQVDGRIHTKRAAMVDHIDQFDADFFGISPREAMRMDPQQRWLLEITWEAMEDAGLVPSQLRGSNTGVFVGISGSDYASLQFQNLKDIDVHTNAGVSLSIASNRISYLFDLRGPSLSIDTACSSALVAIHMSCEQIWSGSCEMALGGGSNLILATQLSSGFSRASMLSPDGECFTFDSRANGYVRGEGCGLVMLMPLSKAIEQGVRIHAVIRATASNQDGATTSMAIPNAAAQVQMLRQAYANAQVPPGQVAYVEAHGTGTPVGDPIEVHALGEVLSEGRLSKHPCLIGSVKTNIGHLEPASGIAGLVKAALILKHDEIPANLNFIKPNPNVPLDAGNFGIVLQNQVLPNTADQAPVVGVNSFGFGGTNAHVVLQKAPNISINPGPSRSIKRPYLLPISARSDTALDDSIKKMMDFFKDDSQNFSDVCTASGQYREHHIKRRVLLANGRDDMIESMQQWLDTDKPLTHDISGDGLKPGDKLVFVFSGQGSQWWGMGQRLMESEPVFNKMAHVVDEKFKAVSGWSIIDEMMRSEQDSQINLTRIAQPTIFTVQVALSKLWESFGIIPDKVIGHSVGEVAAAYCAGIYSLDDAIKVIYHRSRLQNQTGGNGKMAAVGVSIEKARSIITEYEGSIELAVVNSPNLISLAGDSEPMTEAIKKLQSQNIFCKELPIDYAFHTHQMEPIKEELLTSLSDIVPMDGDVPFVSTVTQSVIPGSELDAIYWWRNVREAVLFGPTIEEIIAQGQGVDFLEIGPHSSMQSAIDECASESPNGSAGTYFYSVQRGQDDGVSLSKTLAQLHIHQYQLDWQQVNGGSGSRIPLPSYPWQKQSFWLESSETAEKRLSPVVHPFLLNRVHGPLPAWEFQLDSRLFTYIEDHRVWDSTIFPASAFCEIGIALSHLLFPNDYYIVESLEIKRALFLSPNGSAWVRTVFDESERRFLVYSKEGEQAQWDLNATGQLVKMPQSEVVDVDLDELKYTLPQRKTRKEFYQRFDDAGLTFGPLFQLVQSIYREDGESLTRIVVPDNITRDNNYHIHPATLDSFFHGINATEELALGKTAREELKMPAFIRRIELLAKTPDTFWAYTRVLRDQENRKIADIDLYDETGSRFALIRGFRADAAPANDPSQDRFLNHLYRFEWDPKPILQAYKNASDLPSVTSILSHGKHYQRMPETHERIAKFNNQFQTRLDVLGKAAFLNALVELGWQPAVGEVIRLSGLIEKQIISDKYKSLVSQQFDLLSAEGYFARQDHHEWTQIQPILQRDEQNLANNDSFERIRQDYPWLSANLAFYELCFTNSASLLSGSIDYLELVFSSKNHTTLANYYQNGEHDELNNHVVQALKYIIKTLPSRRVLRVLEIGAGMGSLTEKILQKIPNERLAYTFTDISPDFIEKAKERFTNHRCITFEQLDLNRELDEQNIDVGQFDLVFATNVVHATHNHQQSLKRIRQLLAPDGLFMFVETFWTSFSINNAFGFFPDWWKTFDENQPSQSALLSQPQWLEALQECGFDTASNLAGIVQNDQSFQGLLIARSKLDQFRQELSDDLLDSQEDSSAKQYLLFADNGGLVSQLATTLRARGHHALVVNSGESLGKLDEQTWTLDFKNQSSIRDFFEQEEIADMLWDGLINGLNLDLPPIETMNSEALYEAQNIGAIHAFQFSQVLLELPGKPDFRWFFLTRDCFKPLEIDQCSGFTTRPLVGFLRSANNEMFNHSNTVIDLPISPGNGKNDPKSDPKADQATNDICNDICLELQYNQDELEVAWRNGIRYGATLRRMPKDHLVVSKSTEVARNVDRGNVSSGHSYPITFCLHCDKPGFLDHLNLREIPRAKLQPHEIEVQVMAGGINFRDVMKALGIYPGNTEDLHWYGDDFSGIVIAVGSEVNEFSIGDEVAGFAPYAFRSFVAVDARMVFRKPPHISFIEAACLPTVFSTAHYALVHLGRMTAGETVLIHSGGGGVGQAAIQVAKRLGLRVFATAGTEEKRQLLNDQGVELVMSSRDLTFADEIMAYTRGDGVDGVLNSLAGDFIPKSLSVLAPFGRFLEIGKIDIYTGGRVEMGSLKHNISYQVIDLAEFMLYKPDYISGLLRECGRHLENDEYQPILHKVYPVTEAVSAFKYMSQGKHIGKVVLDFDLPKISVAPNTNHGARFKAEACYLIVGGNRGLGLEVANWMVIQGARHIGLLSRSGPRTKDDLAKIDTMRQLGASIHDLRGDVSEMSDVMKAIQTLEINGLPLKGMVHSALVIDDEFIVSLDQERFDAVMKPKVMGAWNLHLASLERDLDHFIAFSSIASMMGGVKQTNYAAANAFIDGLAEYRRSRNLPVQIFGWGPISGAGQLARDTLTAEYVQKVGVAMMPVSDAIRTIQYFQPYEIENIISADIDWETASSLSLYVSNAHSFKEVISQQKTSQLIGTFKEIVLAAAPEKRTGLLVHFVSEQIGQVLGKTPDEVDPEESIMNMGLDSLMSVELNRRISEQLQIKVPAGRLLGGPSLNELAGILNELLGTPDENDMDHEDVQLEGMELEGTNHETGHRHEYGHTEAKGVALNHDTPSSQSIHPTLRESQGEIALLDINDIDQLPRFDTLVINYLHPQFFDILEVDKDEWLADDGNSRVQITECLNLNQGRIGILRLPYLEERLIQSPPDLLHHFDEARELAKKTESKSGCADRCTVLHYSTGNPTQHLVR